VLGGAGHAAAPWADLVRHAAAGQPVGRATAAGAGRGAARLPVLHLHHDWRSGCKGKGATMRERGRARACGAGDLAGNCRHPADIKIWAANGIRSGCRPLGNGATPPRVRLQHATGRQGAPCRSPPPPSTALGVRSRPSRRRSPITAPAAAPRRSSAPPPVRPSAVPAPPPPPLLLPPLLPLARHVGFATDSPPPASPPPPAAAPNSRVALRVITTCQTGQRGCCSAAARGGRCPVPGA